MVDARRYRWRAGGAALLVGVLLFAAIIGYLQMQRQHRLQLQREEARALAALQTFAIQRQLARSLSSVYALASVLRQYGEIRDFDRFAEALTSAYGGISSLQLAPRGVVRRIYPLAGNERAIGHDLLEDPLRRESALLAINSRALTLAGPFELIQGGTAVVGRLPVFGVGDGTADSFWGFTIALVRLPLLLQESELAKLEIAGYDHVLSSGRAEQPGYRIIARSRREPLQEPIEVPFEVPNGTWILGIAPRTGWLQPPLPVSGLLTALLFAVLGFRFMHALLLRPHRLELLVHERREALERANRELDQTLISCTRVERDLRRSERRIRLLVEYAGEAVFIHDADGRPSEINREARRLLGFPDTPVGSLALRELIRAVDPEHGQIFPIDDRGDYPLTGVQAEVTQPHGRAVPVELYSAKIGAGTDRRYVTFARDISERLENEAALVRTQQYLEARVDHRARELVEANTQLAAEVAERRRTEEELEAARRVAEQATATKSRFLANLSHEIRTPMNGLIGMLNLLSEESLAADQVAQVQAAMTAGESLLVLLDDLLDLAKIEAGCLELDRVNSPFQPWLNEVVRPFEELARRRGLEFRLTVAAGLPGRLVMDAGRVRQVMYNLIDNAIKFTEKGSIFVEIGYRPVSDSGRLEVVVSDTGVGISEEHQRLVFEAFAQADDTLTRRHRGVGLGLALCRRLVKLMGGELTVASHPGHGSRFEFWIDATPGDQHQVSARPPASVGDPVQLHALVVEDDKVSQRVAQAMLERLGWQVTLADDGQQGIEAASSTRFELVLMDLQLPGIDGFAATRRIRELEQGRGWRSVILGCAGETGREVIAACLAAGMDGHVGKPLRKASLREALSNWWPVSQASFPGD